MARTIYTPGLAERIFWRTEEEFEDSRFKWERSMEKHLGTAFKEESISDFTAGVDEERARERAKPKHGPEKSLQLLGIARMQASLRQMLANMLIVRSGETFDEAIQRRQNEVCYLNDPEEERDDGMVIEQHAVDAQVLENKLHEYAVTLDFTREQISFYHRWLYRMILQSRKVDILRQDMPKNEDLFTHCFGEKPEHEIDVIQGPLTLYFRCKTFEDYLTAYVGKQDKRMRKKLSADAKKTIAIAKNPRVFEDEYDFLTVEHNADDTTFNGATVKYFVHEEQHIYHKLFPPFRYLPRSLEIMPAEDIVAHALRSYRVNGQESYAADEILARIREGQSLSAIETTMLVSKGDGLYDFEAKAKETIKDWVLSRYVVKTKVDIEAVMDDVFRCEYEQIVRDALKAVGSIPWNMMEGPDRVELLSRIQLRDWPRVLREVSTAYQNRRE